ncbi:MAG: DUF3494 domain-containing protein [Leptospira sp.]|nr:DUF3494 domain-containing protein [Leptospira sp.]
MYSSKEDIKVKTQTNMKTKIVGGIGMLAMASFMATCAGSGDGKKNSQSFLALLAIAPASISAPVLGSAASFAVFGGGAGITNAGTKTAISGDMGTTGASTMITGFHNLTCGYTETPLNSGYVSGINYTNVPPAFGVLCKEGTVETFAMATSVAADALTAYNDLASRPDGMDPGAGQLGGLTLAPGVYKSASGAFLITGSDLTLDAQGDANAVWIFQMASSLTVGKPTAAQSVQLINGAQAKNVYWQVGSAATINGAGGGTMVGTIIASAGMTFSTAGNQALTTLNGRALGLFAAVTMVNTVINVEGVQAVIPPPPVVVPPTTITGTSPGNVVLAPGAGFINVENNGGLVTATEVGTGTINIVNNGGVLTATNTGNGTMTINSNATGAVTVTNTGNGRVTVNATGAAAVTFTHTGDDDISYP